jgi:signal transduction histidine kinase
MFVFAATVFLLQNPEPFAELDARLRVEANLITNIVLESSVSDTVVEVDSVTGTTVLAPRVSNLFQTVEDYVVVVAPDGGILYAGIPGASVSLVGDTILVTSAEVEGLSVTVRLVEALAAAGREPESEARFGVLAAAPPVSQLRYFVRPINDGPGVAAIVTSAATGTAQLGPRRLLFGMVVSGPFILIASILIGYFLAGRTLSPLDTIINEIEAITDGRSLHRRVISVRSTEELARLSTTLNNMLVRLERSFMSLRRFTADASHELKTPLTVLRSGIERAITHPSAPPSVLEVLEETLVEVNRMTELVDSLLMLARADEGRAPLHLEKGDIRGLLSEVAETASILGEQASVNVSVDVPSTPVVVAVDRSRVRQLFMNLLTNAIKYTGKGGNVWIRCRPADGHLVFTVQDTGIGIASSELPHIFDRFWRADVARSRTGERPGVGLGLAICKWIAEAHGGSISVESQRGKGTTFTVTLPSGEA